jgi:hypothetical protein
MTRCAHCRRPLKRSRVLGVIHADLSYWCFPHDAFHACLDEADNVLFCPSTRHRYGY